MSGDRIDFPTLGASWWTGARRFWTVAYDEASLWVGLVFVIAAGSAREYDREIYTKTWHLLLPLAASVVLSFLLFTVIDGRNINAEFLYEVIVRFLGVFDFRADGLAVRPAVRALLLPPRCAMKANLVLLAFISGGKACC